MDTLTETIAAVATPTGRGGVGIVRVSGPLVGKVALAILKQSPAPRTALYRDFIAGDDSVIDSGIALYFPGPHSFTGEDVLELQGHGGPVVMDMLLEAVTALGVRLARPGEFSERAFLNDKLDLAQAEAIADLIDSDTRAAARAALHSLQGDFSERIHVLVAAMIQLRIHVEAAIDFPEEEIDFLADGAIESQLEGIEANLAEVLAAAHQGTLLRDGMTLVIAGKPNAGKSSLLNALAGTDTAIVTDIPGTTRDVLRERIQIDGMPLHIVDTAGIRDSDDPVEQEGIRRAWHALETADRMLLMVDARQGLTAEDRHTLSRCPEGLPVTVVHNKIDLTDRQTLAQDNDGLPHLWLSAKMGVGLDLLREHLKQEAGYCAPAEGGFSARRRHLDALDTANEHLGNARIQLIEHKAGELLAEELRLSQDALSTITGEFTNDDLLGKIFTSFCIGK